MDEPGNFLNFFPKTGANLHPCLAVTPIESSFAKAGKISFFSGKGGFLLSVCRKNLNKGDDGLSAFIGGCQCRAPVGTGDFRKFMKFFLKTGAKTYPCLAITPIEGHLVAGFGWIRLFSKKAGKTLIVFKKIPNIRYGCFLLGKAKKGGDSGFWAETMKKTKDFY